MKKVIICLVTMGFIMLIGVVVYQLYFSFPSVLKEEGFSKKDILVSEEYLSDLDQLTKISLLANQDKIGLVIAHKNKYGLWRSGITSMVEGPADEEFITTGHTLMEMQNGEVLSESHIYVAYYIGNEKPDEIKSPPHFDLKVNYFKVNDRTLLFAHGIARNGKGRFGSDEVITYLQLQLKVSHSE